jgi:hypothetical protein
VTPSDVPSPPGTAPDVPQSAPADAIVLPPTMGDEPSSRTDDLLDECRMMLAFAREVGLALLPDLARDIAALDRLLTQVNLPPISELPRSLLSADVPSAAGASGTSPKAPEPLSATELVLRVHGALSTVIAPATPLTLQATEPTDGRRGVFARMPRIVKVAAVWSIISAVFYLVSAAQLAATALHSHRRQASDVVKTDPSAAVDDGPRQDGVRP